MPAAGAPPGWRSWFQGRAELSVGLRPGSGEGPGEGRIWGRAGRRKDPASAREWTGRSLCASSHPTHPPRRALGMKPPSLPARAEDPGAPLTPAAAIRQPQDGSHERPRTRVPVPGAGLAAGGSAEGTAAVTACREQKTAELYDSPIRHREREERGLIDALKIAGSIFDPERRIPVGRGREKGRESRRHPDRAERAGEMEGGSRPGHSALPVAGFPSGLGAQSTAAGSRRHLPPRARQHPSREPRRGLAGGQLLLSRLRGEGGGETDGDTSLGARQTLRRGFCSPELPLTPAWGARGRAEKGRCWEDQKCQCHIWREKVWRRSGENQGAASSTRPTRRCQVPWPSPAVQGWNRSDGGEYPSETPQRNPQPQATALGLKKDGSRWGQTLRRGTRCPPAPSPATEH